MIYVDHIDVCPRRVYVTEGKTNRELRAEASPVNATCREIKWISDDPEIAEINEQTGYITGKKVGTVQVYALATDGSGEKERVTVVVEEESDISLDHYSVTMHAGEELVISANIVPERIAYNGITGFSTDLSALTIKKKDKNSITVKAVHEGNAVVVIRSYGDRSLSACCQFIILPALVPQITFPSRTITIDKGNEVILFVNTYALNDNKIKWDSNNGCVNVDQNGKITALREGDAIITANITGCDASDECHVYVVDPNKKVAIIDDGGGDFSLVFPSATDDPADSKVWHSVGCDLLELDNRTNHSLDIGQLMGSLNVPESRYVANIQQTFTLDEIAFLYRFDPLGIEFYMRTHACKDKDELEKCLFKDQVYAAIFDIRPGWFKFVIGNNNQPIYDDYDYLSRKEYFTNAEILFGAHAELDLLGAAVDIAIALLYSLPGIDKIKDGVDFYQSMLFADSVVGSVTNAAKYFADSYFNYEIKEYLDENKQRFKGYKCVLWVLNAISTVSNAVKNNYYYIPNPETITVCDKVVKNDKFTPVIMVDNEMVALAAIQTSVDVDE